MGGAGHGTGLARRGRSIVLAALAGATQMLSGGAEVIFNRGFCWGVWGVGAFCGRNSPGENDVRALGVGGLAAGLAAAQLLPFLDLLAHSQRNSGYGSLGSR